MVSPETSAEEMLGVFHMGAAPLEIHQEMMVVFTLNKQESGEKILVALIEFRSNVRGFPADSKADFLKRIDNSFTLLMEYS